jgi:hypothetical protein
MPPKAVVVLDIHVIGSRIEIAFPVAAVELVESSERRWRS